MLFFTIFPLKLGIYIYFKRNCIQFDNFSFCIFHSSSQLIQFHEIYKKIKFKYYSKTNNSNFDQKINCLKIIYEN